MARAGNCSGFLSFWGGEMKQTKTEKFDKQEFVTRPDLARHLGLSVKTLKRYVDDGVLPEPSHLNSRVVGWDAWVVQDLLN